MGNGAQVRPFPLGIGSTTSSTECGRMRDVQSPEESGTHIDTQDPGALPRTNIPQPTLLANIYAEAQTTDPLIALQYLLTQYNALAVEYAHVCQTLSAHTYDRHEPVGLGVENVPVAPSTTLTGRLRNLRRRSFKTLRGETMRTPPSQPSSLPADSHMDSVSHMLEQSLRTGPPPDVPRTTSPGLSNTSPRLWRKPSNGSNATSSYPRYPESPSQCYSASQISLAQSTSPRIMTRALSPPAGQQPFPRSSSSRPTTPLDRGVEETGMPTALDAAILTQADIMTMGSFYYGGAGPDAVGFRIRLQYHTATPEVARRRRNYVRVEKTWKDLVALHDNAAHRLAQTSHLLAPTLELPDRVLFEAPYAPWRQMERNTAVDAFLNAVQRLPVPCEDLLLPFFSTNLTRDPEPDAEWGACLRQEVLLRQAGEGWAVCTCALYANTLVLHEPQSGSAPDVLDLRRIRIGRQFDMIPSPHDHTTRFPLIVLQSMLPSPLPATQHHIKLATESFRQHTDWMTALLHEFSEHSTDKVALDGVPEAENRSSTSIHITPSTPGRDSDTSSERSHAVSPRMDRHVSSLPQSPPLPDSMRHTPATKSRLRHAAEHGQPHAPTNDKRRYLFGLLTLGSGEESHEKSLFGAPISEAAKASGLLVDPSLSPVPAIVKRCIDMLEHCGALNDEGLYRVSGSSSVMKVLYERFTALGDVDLEAEYKAQRMRYTHVIDSHAVAGLLKMYLRELPDNLCTDVLLPDFTAAAEMPEREERLRTLRHLLDLVPAENYSTLRLVCQHLCHVLSFCHTNKMTLPNLSIVFCATLRMSNELVIALLSDFDILFKLPRHHPDTDAFTIKPPGPTAIKPAASPEQQQQQQQQQRHGHARTRSLHAVSPNRAGQHQYRSSDVSLHSLTSLPRSDLSFERPDVQTQTAPEL